MRTRQIRQPIAGRSHEDSGHEADKCWRNETHRAVAGCRSLVNGDPQSIPPPDSFHKVT
ncbi:hypothetical protein E2C01_091929 [Portunus trituberculatus]|uniref:Uncharacterized protein n=1 Tax=Portunus trituberculatus TaxID=210409 RepID=A0A5B7JU93_PORTR|nr:hypothetical protein [Portunus trituberculatus]